MCLWHQQSSSVNSKLEVTCTNCRIQRCSNLQVRDMLLLCHWCCCVLQVEKDMIEVLQQVWLDGHLATVREEVKKCEK
jgi:hypothetical protein